LKSPRERVDTLATLTEVEVTPVWSLKALWGIGRPGTVEPPAAAVVVVDDELVELHAAATSATARIMPSAADRLFPETERKAPPMSC
jgi:hypothetical protein